MFYDRNHPELANWWDCLDEDGRDDLGEEETEGVVSISFEQKEEEQLEGATGRVGEGDSPGYEVRESRSGDELVPETATSSLARGYDLEVVHSVWAFAEVVEGNDPGLWRKDEFGNWIHRLDYGRRESEFGWEIFDPGIGRHSQGVYAMRPMQWETYLRQHEVFR
ncbi:MAG: hypothetical protein AAGC68_06930 [Verrucomicrobiota bacterium]